MVQGRSKPVVDRGLIRAKRRPQFDCVRAGVALLDGECTGEQPLIAAAAFGNEPSVVQVSEVLFGPASRAALVPDDQHTATNCGKECVMKVEAPIILDRL